MILGLDLGSGSTKGVLVDDSLRPVQSFEMLTRGQFGPALEAVVNRLFEGLGAVNLKIGVTGSGRAAFRFPAGVRAVNDIVALALGATLECPEAKTAIEVGSEISRWVALGEGRIGGLDREILDFAMNEQCAAGSGAFLEQQAARLKLGIDEFSSLAASAGRGAPVAGRCSVFAKTDMVHLQQKGTPLDEIALGVCLALARNFSGTILRGRDINPPVFFTGGGARNPGLARAFREVLDLGPESFIVGASSALTCALGAAAAASCGADIIEIETPSAFLGSIEAIARSEKIPSPPLGRLTAGPAPEPSGALDGFIEAYLGIDVGSVSTDFALVDESGGVAASVYLPTRGRPLEVLRQGYEILKSRCRWGLGLLGIGTTGSGRHLAGRVFEADIVHNEITCQLAGAAHFIPDADTIFEIGGQDSKFIRARDGRIVDFAMNKICAAGTGSFLEEQAEPMGIKIEDRFSDLASQSAGPRDLGSRCTVFMDSEVAEAIGRGVSLPDLCAGLAFSVARNYLEKVVAGRPLGRRIVFQGGVASNAAVVRAFSLLLGRPIDVHPYNRISGAIGAALLARERVARRGRTSPPEGVLEKRILEPHRVTSFECRNCPNRCQVNRIQVGAETIFFGDTCERYTSGQSAPPGAAIRGPAAESAVLDLFGERQAELEGSVRRVGQPAGRVAIPRASFVLESLPFWAAFFSRLGYDVELSAPSGAETLEEGLRGLTAETCLPIKIVLGHIGALRLGEADWIFFPSIVDLHKTPEEPPYLCAYTEHAPLMIKRGRTARLLAPAVAFGSTAEDFCRSLRGLEKSLGVDAASIREAYDAASAAQRRFRRDLQERGKTILESAARKERIRLAVLGRPYNLYDPFLNLNLARHLRNLDVLAVPMEYLPSDPFALDSWKEAPRWRYDRQILQAAMWCAGQDDVYPLILSNFGCGPDAFSLKHLEKILDKTPHLVLEFDEHRAEAGLITRLEAFLDEVREGTAEPGRNRETATGRVFDLARFSPAADDLKNRRLVIPQFADHAHAFAGALKSVGIEATVLQPPDEKTVALGEAHTSGRECHAYAYLVGDLLKYAESERPGGEVYYFPGADYLCVLQQYHETMRLLLEKLGISDLAVLDSNGDRLWKMLGFPGMKSLWQGVVAVDMLIKAQCETRPYETTAGETDRVHSQNLRDIENGLADGSIFSALKRCSDRLMSIETRPEPRLKIGVAGDIYTRINRVANHDLFLRLEALGCEVWPPSFFVEDADFTFQKQFVKRLNLGHFHEGAAAGLLILRKEFERWKIRRALGPAGRGYRELTFKEARALGSAYVGLDNCQTLLLNIARMAAFARRGAAGVINAMCFNCMLGTVSAAISTKVRRDFAGIPIPTLVYSGTESTIERTKLEAFVYQVRQFAEKKRLGAAGDKRPWL